MRNRMQCGAAGFNGGESPFRRLRRFVDSIPASPDAAFFDTMLSTGCRVAEIVGVRLGDIRMIEDGKAMAIRVTGKSIERDLILSGNALAKLKRYLSENPPLRKEPLFRDHRGCPWSPWTVYERLRKWTKILGYPAFTPHDFRHAFAMALASQDISPFLSCRLLGHKLSSASLQYYLPSSSKSKGKARRSGKSRKKPKRRRRGKR